MVAEQRSREQWELTVGSTAHLKTVLGNATYKKLLLYVEGEGGAHFDAHESSLKLLNDIEHELAMSGSSYHLVAVILGNSTHWCRITLFHGKYLLYDSMFQGERLRWVSRSFELSSLRSGNFKVGGLWYLQVLSKHKITKNW